MHAIQGAYVEGGEPICTITNPFKTENVVVEAPFDGLLVGAVENPLVYPGNPICHPVKVDERTRRAIEREDASRGPTSMRSRRDTAATCQSGVTTVPG